jgi:uncharacterized protein YceK
MRTALIVFLVASAVSGCAAARERVIAQNQKLCASYGFTPGTAAYSNCLMEQDLPR